MDFRGEERAGEKNEMNEEVEVVRNERAAEQKEEEDDEGGINGSSRG